MDPAQQAHLAQAVGARNRFCVALLAAIKCFSRVVCFCFNKYEDVPLHLQQVDYFWSKCTYTLMGSAAYCLLIGVGALHFHQLINFNFSLPRFIVGFSSLLAASIMMLLSCVRCVSLFHPYSNPVLYTTPASYYLEAVEAEDSRDDSLLADPSSPATTNKSRCEDANIPSTSRVNVGVQRLQIENETLERHRPSKENKSSEATLPEMKSLPSSPTEYDSSETLTQSRLQSSSGSTTPTNAMEPAMEESLLHFIR